MASIHSGMPTNSIKGLWQVFPLSQPLNIPTGTELPTYVTLVVLLLCLFHVAVVSHHYLLEVSSKIIAECNLFLSYYFLYGIFSNFYDLSLQKNINNILW